jgi:hypothetical protein
MFRRRGLEYAVAARPACKLGADGYDNAIRDGNDVQAASLIGTDPVQLTTAAWALGFRRQNLDFDLRKMSRERSALGIGRSPLACLPRACGSLIAQIGKSVHFCPGNVEILESQSILVGREFLRARAEAKMLKLVDEVLHAGLAAEAFADHGFERVDIVRKVDFLLIHGRMVAYSHAPATPIR